MASEIRWENGRLLVPDRPIIPYIEGDGIGPDIWAAAQLVLNQAVAKAYGGRREVQWLEVLAGEKAREQTGEYLPRTTLDSLRRYLVGIKGPLTTPVGGGIRSLNVAIRQELDLYACVRPVRWYAGTPSPVCHPERVDMVIFRENTEDVYAGLEWKAGSPEMERLEKALFEAVGVKLAPATGLGLKPISAAGSRRLVRKAIRYALDNKRSSVTLVHKGNIMKHTEGYFRDLGYQLAREEFPDTVVAERDWDGKDLGPGKLVLKDRIADNMFQQILLRPEEYDVLATLNLNGDYLSDALAAQVGGLGLAPGGNLSDEVAVFEATHGTAPKYAGLDKVNPGSLILSGVMLLRHLGWAEAAQLVETGLGRTIAQRTVTYDLARSMEGAREVSTSGFGRAVVENFGA